MAAAKKRTGSFYPLKRADGRSYYRGRLRLADKSREWIDIPANMNEARARAYVNWAQEQEDKMGALYRAKLERQGESKDGELWSKWVERWILAREARGLSAADSDAGRMRQHVTPILGAIPMPAIERTHVEDVRDALDRKVAAGDLSWKTAKNAWGLITKAFADACNAKDRSLRCLRRNPCEGVAAPDAGGKTSKVYLYPDELLQLAACEAVTLGWRRLYVVSIYMFARAAELMGLEWVDVDLVRGTALVHVQTDRRTGERRETKSNKSRRIPIEAELLPLLTAMRRDAPDSRLVFEEMNETDRKLARGLRRDLLIAGVTRAELHEPTKTRKAMTFHDLRATGITWGAVRGDEPLRLMQRAGHATFSTTQGYIREAENLRDGFGTVFPRLPASLLEPGQTMGQVRRRRIDTLKKAGGGAGNRTRRNPSELEDSPTFDGGSGVSAPATMRDNLAIAGVTGPTVGPTSPYAPRLNFVAGVIS